MDESCSRDGDIPAKSYSPPYITRPSLLSQTRPSFKEYLPQEDMSPPYGQSNSGSYQINHQNLHSPPALVAGENMSTFETGFHPMGETPPLQVFPPSRGDWDDQVTSREQYRGSFSEQVPFPWRQDPYENDCSDGNAGFCTPGIGNARPVRSNTLSDDGSSPRSPNQSFQYSTMHSYGTVGPCGAAGSDGTLGSCGAVSCYGGSNTSYSQLGAMSLGSR